MRAVMSLQLLTLFLPPLLLGQAERLPPDAASNHSPFQRDSASAAIPVANRLLTVRAERGSGVSTTGRYMVFLDNQPLAAATSEELYVGAPSVTFISAGEPSVVLLSTYTGGQGASAVPGYYLKLVVLSETGAQAFTLDSKSVGEIPFDHVVSITRPSDGQFQLSLWGGMRLTYANRQLDVTPGT